MVKKGIISVFNAAERTAEVIIPELDDVVTPMIPISREIPTDSVNVGDKCIVALFSNSFADGAVISMI
jgi:hypothetical protein